MTRGWQRSLSMVVWLGMVLCLWVQLRAAVPQNQKPAAAAAATDAAPAAKPFFLHAFHAKDMGLDCSTCHTPVKEGSVSLQRPGHDQCMACHADAFGDNLNPKLCEQCHTAFPPTSTEDLRPFPRYKGVRSLLIEFSHAKHVDPKARVDAHSGFRGDCSFCHSFNKKDAKNAFPVHEQCASCHSKAGMVPQLSAASTTADCRGCHNPEEIENPGSSGAKPRMLSAQVLTGRLENIKFSHPQHFQYAKQQGMTCETCHSQVHKSTSLETLSLPKMSDCVQCHDMQKTMQSSFRLSNCQSCHVGGKEGALPGSHTRWVRPASHTMSFRQHHQEDAAMPGANCYACHTNIVVKSAALGANGTGGAQCAACHQVMRPASHTPRWRDDIHGKYAALDRETCATCHQTDFCSRCHNQTPRSHLPLALFKGGAHARLAQLNERSCLTCHTFQNTCSQCHSNTIR